MSGSTNRYGGDYSLAELFRAGISPLWAERFLHEGRLAQRVFDHYWMFHWAEPRFSGSAGVVQERFYNRFGKDAYFRRIDRMKRYYDKIVAPSTTLCRKSIKPERARPGDISPGFLYLTTVKRYDT